MVATRAILGPQGTKHHQQQNLACATTGNLTRRISKLFQTATEMSMVIGMATQKITITLESAQVESIRSLIASGQAQSVSGFVQHAVKVSLDDVAGWGAMLAEALNETGGPLTASEKAWADEALGISKVRAPKAA
jgi:Arc/MetJ-type ribon-helix-helix transcriptional regulator